MYTKLFVVAVVALLCNHASADDVVYSKQQTQDFDTCTAGLPPSLTGEAEHWVTHTLSSYLKCMDKTFESRLKEIFLTGRENRTVDSLCVIENSEPYDVGRFINDNYTSASLGVVVPTASRLHSNGLIHTVFYLPNTRTPALTVNWMIVLSDQHTYALLVACMPDGHRGYALFTTIPELAPKSLETIKTYLKSSGFNEDLGTGELYSSAQCSNKLNP